MSSENKPIFRDLNADDPDPETTEIESLCMNCHATGITKLLLTKIPFYKEVVIMSFSCEECGYQNNEIQPGGQIAEKGIKIQLKIIDVKDLNRKVVKSDYTNIEIPEVSFEIPAKSQKGEVTTVEGVLERAITGLEQDQSVRRIQHPEVAQQIDDFVLKLTEMKTGNVRFTLILNDISGNCFIENPHVPQSDLNCTTTHYVRSKVQDHELGIFSKEERQGEESNLLHPIAEDECPIENFEQEVIQFPTNCSNCGSPCETNMKMTNIPHFKEVVIMATICEVCGHRSNEVKSGAGIQDKGLRIEIDVESRDDFSRDLLKSETCCLSIPQLELEVGSYALGGRFTTVEGLLTAIRDQLNDPSSSHMIGDSTDSEKKVQMQRFMEKFGRVLDGKFPVTLVLDDPAGNSYIQSLADDGDKPDTRLRLTHYERSFEQNEDLGINDMKTENY